MTPVLFIYYVAHIIIYYVAHIEWILYENPFCAHQVQKEEKYGLAMRRKSKDLHREQYDMMKMY